MCPASHKYNVKYREQNLRTEPAIIIEDPNVIHGLKPYFSIIQIDAKFIGKYTNKSIYLTS